MVGNMDSQLSRSPAKGPGFHAEQVLQCRVEVQGLLRRWHLSTFRLHGALYLLILAIL